MRVLIAPTPNRASPWAMGSFSRTAHLKGQSAPRLLALSVLTSAAFALMTGCTSTPPGSAPGTAPAKTQFATCEYLIFRGHRYEWSRLPGNVMPGVGAPLGTAKGHRCGDSETSDVKVYSYMEEPVAEGLTTSDSTGVHVYDIAG